MSEVKIFYNGPIVTREDAKSKGKKRYFTGIPCRNKHISQRYVISVQCCQCSILNVKKYVSRNPEKIYARTKSWRNRNPDKARASYRRARKKRLSTIYGRLNNRVSAAIYHCLKFDKKGHRWEKLVGYSIQELKEHLEKNFTQGMDWGKFLNGEIHLDHIYPISSFNFTSYKDLEFKKCWALSNLQPLWAIDNFKKNKKNPIDWAQENGHLL